MDPIQVPEDLSDLSDEELADLGFEIRERVETLADDAKQSDDVLAELEAHVEQFNRVNGELNAREQAASEREERVGALLEGFAPTEADEAEEIVEAEVDEVAEAASDEPVEAVADEAAEAATEDDVVAEAAVEDDAVAETAIEDAVEETVVEDQVEASAEDAVEVASDKSEVAEAAADEVVETAQEEGIEIAAEEIVEAAAEQELAPVRRQPVAAALRSRRPAAAEPVEVAPVSNAAVTKSRVNENGLVDGDPVAFGQLAELVVDKRRQIAQVPSGTFEKVTLASSVADHEFTLGTGHEENFEILKAVRERQVQARTEVNALVAAGGNCAPLEPSYDFFRLAEALNPIEECLPEVGAPRGGIRFISPPDFRDAAGGVRVTTEAEDAAGYPPTAPKPCVEVVCPPIEECRVDVVSRCVRFGNLNFRVFPEQVESFLQDLSVIFTETKEVFYIDAIDAASVDAAEPATYGAVRSMINSLARAAANYRRRHHMAADATLELFLPSWVAELVYVDMVNDHSMGLSFVGENPAGAVTRALAQLNLNVCWYYDGATGAGQDFDAAQAGGGAVINAFPATVRSYLFAPGTFVRLDAGTLDLGVVRDSTLNGTNDLEMFAEQWIQVCFVGLESIRIDHTLCPDGTAPEPVPPFVC